MAHERIYLDHNATTPLREEVVEAMARVLRDLYGNPSSTHAEGVAARAVLERAREQVAALVGVHPEEVVLTSGASEANNTAIASRLLAASARPGHLVTTRIEHPSVIEPVALLERQGWKITRAPVDADGQVELPVLLAALEAETSVALEAETHLISVIWANNETGVIQPMGEIARAAAERGIPLHTDATQAVGKVPVDLREIPATLLSASAHKFNGPKGTGFLVVRGGHALEPWIRGGPQERRRRGGTENMAGIVGLGVACELALTERDARAARYQALRDRLWGGVRAAFPEARVNGRLEQVLPNTLNVEIPGVAGEILLEALDLEGVSVSVGAACASGAIEPSPVLAAMGRSAEQARSSLRLSVGHGVTEAQIDRVLELLPKLVLRVREAGS